MKKLFPYVLSSGVIIASLLGNVKIASGELVYEDDLSSSSGTMLESTNVSESAPTETVETADRSERKDLPKTEMLRRQRVREELKNEDLLSQKLEELRLKDEMKRSEKLNENLANEDKREVAPATPVVEQKVGSMADVSSSPVMMSPNGTASVGSLEASSELKELNKEQSAERISVAVRAGLGGIKGSIYNIESKFAFGLGVGVDVSDHIAFTGGWTYSRYNLGASNSILSYPIGFGFNQYRRTLQLNDNVFDLGMRGYILGRSSKVRPFVGGGFAYRRGYINYDQNTRNVLRMYDPVGAQDINISGMSAFLEAGLDFKITDTISLFGMFRYYGVLVSNQSSPINPNAFYNGTMAAPGAIGYNNDVRNQAGNDLTKTNFYQLVGGLSIAF